MNDNQFAELLLKLKGYFEPLYVLIGLCLFVLIFIFLVVFFDYYDKTIRVKKEDITEKFREICRDELNKRDIRNDYRYSQFVKEEIQKCK